MTATDSAIAATMVAVIALAAACGGDDSDEPNSTAGAAEDDSTTDGDSGTATDDPTAPDDDSGSDTSDGNSAVVDPAAPGQATASVDGLDLTFELPGALACAISDEAITFSYRIGDNEIVLGGGAELIEAGLQALHQGGDSFADEPRVHTPALRVADLDTPHRSGVDVLPPEQRLFGLNVGGQKRICVGDS